MKSYDTIALIICAMPFFLGTALSIALFLLIRFRSKYKKIMSQFSNAQSEIKALELSVHDLKHEGGMETLVKADNRILELETINNVAEDKIAELEDAIQNTYVDKDLLIDAEDKIAELEDAIQSTYVDKDLLIDAEHKIFALESDLDDTRDRLTSFESANQSHQERIRDLELSIRRIPKEVEEKKRTQWLTDASSTFYRNEIEVEVKFIAPLVSYLGYSSELIRLREPVSFKVGSQDTRGEANRCSGRSILIALIKTVLHH